MADSSQNSNIKFQRFRPQPLDEHPGPTSDEDMTDVMDSTEEQPSRLILGVDFGTTFSSIAYSRFKEDTPRDALDLRHIECISNYPDYESTYLHERREDVPTELWYDTRKSLMQGQSSGNVDVEAAGDDYMVDETVDSEMSDDASDPPSEGYSDSEDSEERRRQQATRKSTPFWGFGVQKQLNMVDIPKDDAKRLSRFKLMLDQKRDETNIVREDLAPILKNLKRSQLIKKDTDVIADYLKQLFDHTRDELENSNELPDNIKIDFVLCVPAVWTSKACRIMEEAMAKAAQSSGLGTLADNSLNNLFIVSEPEAAAACVLAERNHTISKDEVIVVLDAGGGTVDAATFKVTNSLPLRLSEEVVKSSSKLCGASFINEKYKDHLEKRLKHETYLVKNGKTIKSIVESKVMEFENGVKRWIDTTSKNFHLGHVYIDDLRPAQKKDFYRNRLAVTKSSMTKIFESSLKGTAEVLKEQLDLAKAKGYLIQKVILVGGFGQSPSLRSHLRKVLDLEKNCLDQEISLLTPHASSTVVARGAVLQAFDKENGPARITRCSYGFLRTEPYDIENYPAHKNARCIIDKADGEKYIDKTIIWLIKKDECLPSWHERPVSVIHTFKRHKKRFICREEVYVSDDLHPDHYRKSHPMNKGAILAGSIEVDMTFLKEQGLIEEEQPSEFCTFEGSRRQSYWKVEFDLVMILDGRNLRYEARWPPKREDQVMTEQQVQESGQISIAAAFRPGTV